MDYYKTKKDIEKYLQYYKKATSTTTDMTRNYIFLVTELISNNKETYESALSKYFNDDILENNKNSIPCLCFKCFLLYKMKQYQEVLSIFDESIYPQMPEKEFAITYSQEYDLYLYSLYKINNMEKEKVFSKVIPCFLNTSNTKFLSLMSIYILSQKYKDKYLSYLYYFTYHERQKYYKNENQEYNLFMLTNIHKDIILNNTIEAINKQYEEPLTNKYTYNSFNQGNMFIKIQYNDNIIARIQSNTENSTYVYVYCIEQILNYTQEQDTIRYSTSDFSTGIFSKDDINKLKYTIEMTQPNEAEEAKELERAKEANEANEAEEADEPEEWGDSDDKDKW